MNDDTLLHRLSRYVRRRLLLRGILQDRHVFSSCVMGVSRDDLDDAEPDHGTARGCDAWPIHRVLEVLEAGEPLGFVHYGDGEGRLLFEGFHKGRENLNIKDPVFRRLLSESLERASEAESDVRSRFLVGLPCPRCHGPKADRLLKWYPGFRDAPRVTATLFHHSFRWSRQRLVAAVASRPGPLYLVCSTEHDLDVLEAAFGRPFDSVLRTERFTAHLRPDIFRPWLRDLRWAPDGTGEPAPTLLLLCGMVGRLWAVDAFLANPASVTLCLGSLFDDVALGRTRSYVSGDPDRPRCTRCLRPG